VPAVKRGGAAGAAGGGAVWGAEGGCWGWVGIVSAVDCIRRLKRSDRLWKQGASCPSVGPVCVCVCARVSVCACVRARERVCVCA